MAPHPLLLLPPSAGKAPGGVGPAWHEGEHRFAALAPARAELRAAVDHQIARRSGLTTLFGVSERALPGALAEWASLDAAPTLPAAERYTGVVWTALGCATLTPGARRRLRGWVIVVSGLWGLVGMDDPLPPYRLPIGARPAELGNLASWWGPRLAPELARAAAGAWVFDLLPDDHAAAIATAGIRRCRVLLVSESGAGRRAVGHAGKAAKGRLARAILEAGPRTPRALAQVRAPGLASVEASSDEVIFAVD